MRRKIKSLNLTLTQLKKVCKSSLPKSFLCFGYGAYYCTIDELSNCGFMGLDNCRFEMFEFDTNTDKIVSTICLELYFSVN